MHSDWQHLLDFIDTHDDQPLALATLVQCSGSSYRPIGARLLVDSCGNFAGSLSGGCLEAGVAKIAQQVIADGINRTEQINTLPHFGCPGLLTIQIEKISSPSSPNSLLAQITDHLKQRDYFSITTNAEGTTLGNKEGYTEDIAPRPRLIIVGSTSDQDPLLEIANTLGWECIRVVQDRAIATSLNTVASEHLTVCPAAEFQNKFRPDKSTAILIMSHHLTTDLAYLKQVATPQYGYIGLLGSRGRREKLLHELGESGLLEDPEWIKSFYTPIGLDIGADHPSTIALSILAEIQAVFSNSKAGFLRDKLGKIHHNPCSVSS